MIKYTIYGSFEADEDLQASNEYFELYGALLAQLEEQHNVRLSVVRTEVETSGTCCGACGLLYEDGTVHVCDLATVPAGESAVVSWFLLSTLHELTSLIDTSIYLTTSMHPDWIVLTGDMIRTNRGSMQLKMFRAHYHYGAQLHEAINETETK